MDSTLVHARDPLLPEHQPTDSDSISLVESGVSQFVDDGLLRDLYDDRPEEKCGDNQLPAFPHPFNADEDTSSEGRFDAPRTLIELKMCELSSVLREKPQWWEKIKDQSIVEKWRQEANEQEKTVKEESLRLSPSMINYVLAELHGYAAVRESDTGIEIGSFERIWRSDTLISEDLRKSLLDATKLLESSPPDWHPGSGGKVLDLVHPSLYPIVYEKSLAWFEDEDGSRQVRVIEKPSTGGDHMSSQYAWLSSDFDVKLDGTVSLVSPYINNLSPDKHATIYPAVENLVAAAVPMWERVLSDLRRPLAPLRLQSAPVESADYSHRYYGIDCIWPDGQPYAPEEIEEDQDAADEWLRKQPKRLPKALESYSGELEKAVTKTIDLKGRKIQVIVKLANIVLKPGQEYGGGSWHVEGMENEMIVASFIYYYDEENLTPSKLAFRTAVGNPSYHDQNDSICMQTLYGIDRDDVCVQDRGSVTTCQHRCLAFPNVYQHCVSPFNLKDPTKPGHRKIVALFLVNPSSQILSVTQVLRQELELYSEAIRTCPAFNAFPAEIKDEISRLGADGKMTRTEAEEVRKRLMKERTMMVGEMEDGGKYFGQTFNMCYAFPVSIDRGPIPEIKINPMFTKASIPWI